MVTVEDVGSTKGCISVPEVLPSPPTGIVSITRLTVLPEAFVDAARAVFLISIPGPDGWVPACAAAGG